MKKEKLDFCPVCNGKLSYSKLICEDCKAEFPVGETFTCYNNLTAEQNKFLLLFLKSRGNIKTVCEETGLSYPTIKRKLDNLLKSLNLSEEEEVNVDMSNFGKVDYTSNKPSEIVRRKLYEADGKVKIKLLDGKECIVVVSEDGKAVTSDKLNNYTLQYEFRVFDMIADFLKAAGGSAPKGNSYGKEDKVGYEQGKCTADTIVGHIAINYSERKYGDWAYDPVFVLAAIMDWAGIAKNRRGYVELNEEFMSESTEEVMKKTELEFEKELLENAKNAKDKHGYNASYYYQMIYKHGGVKTAKMLIDKAIRTGNPSDGYTKLYIMGDLDLTMEASVCKEEYKSLFTEEEIQYCKSVLKR